MRRAGRALGTVCWWLWDLFRGLFLNILLDWDLISAQRQLAKDEEDALRDESSSTEPAAKALVRHLTRMSPRDAVRAMGHIEGDYRWELDRRQAIDGKVSALLQASAVAVAAVLGLGSLLLLPRDGSDTSPGVPSYLSVGLLVLASVFLSVALVECLCALRVSQLHTIGYIPDSRLVGSEANRTAKATERPLCWLAALLRSLLMALCRPTPEHPLNVAWNQDRVTQAARCIKLNRMGTQRKLNVVHAAQRRLAAGVSLFVLCVAVCLLRFLI